jgi:2-iminobutanoate/2-iminopropanoate deaminase
MMIKEMIITKEAPEAVGPYSQGIRVGDWLYISGQIPLDPITGSLVEGDIVDQTHRVLKSASAILKAAGGSLDDVVKVTIYMTDLGDFSKVNQVYAQYFKSSPPARSCVQVSALPKGAALEVDMVAFLTS